MKRTKLQIPTAQRQALKDLAHLNADREYSLLESVKRPRTERTPKSLEICCGHAGLTEALSNEGFIATGIDWAGNRHKAKVPILKMDLTTKAGQRRVLRLLKDTNLAYVHVGPPCGTSTKARETFIPKWKMRQGCPVPVPLLSADYAKGSPSEWLSTTDQIKVRKGNALSKFCARVARICSKRNIYWSMESPLNPYIWQMPAQKRLLKIPQVRSVDFQNCMWGARGKPPQQTFARLPHRTRLQSR